jgi:DNA-binding transcriptional MerR regulator
MTTSEPAQRPPVVPHLAQPSFRSGHVARMAGMPVATLRIWEQRYQAVRPTTAASGHRLYTAADVERVSLLRRLTQQGHAIGLLAALDTDHLRKTLLTAAEVLAAQGNEPALQPAEMKIVVVGRGLARRLQRWGERQPGGQGLQWVGVFDSLADACQAAKSARAPEVNVLLWQAPSLQPGASHELRAAQAAWGAQSAAVLYRYSSAAGRTELAGTGAAVLQEPADDEALGLLLASLRQSFTTLGQDRSASALAHCVTASFAENHVTAPRFADLALTEFAGLSSAIACECPGHLAQLLLQISNFEKYSGDCAHRSPADAQLHAYLQRTAGSARMLFEAALEHVAIAEGLPLPDSAHVTSFSSSVAARPAPTDSSI